jgi:two-component system, NarL family, response regulator YdfI
MNDPKIDTMELEPSQRSLIQVLIVANSAIVRAGLAALLTSHPTMQVVGSSAAFSTSTQPLPDVVLLEWDSPEEDLASLIRLDFELSAVVMLLKNWHYGIESLLKTGVRGLLPNEATGEEIGAALEAAANGLIVIHPDIMDNLLSNLPARSLAESLQPLQPLTVREIEVLGMLAEGVGNKTIARRLDISEHTVKFHIGSIFSKLDASSRTEAVIVGARQGLILL